MSDLRGYIGVFGTILVSSLAVACGIGGVDGGDESTSGSRSEVRAVPADELGGSGDGTRETRGGQYAPGEGCGKIEGDEIGREGATMEIDGVTVTFTNWIEKDGGGDYVGFDVDAEGHDVTLRVKSGTETVEGAGDHWENPNGTGGPSAKGISHIIVCIEPGEPGDGGGDGGAGGFDEPGDGGGEGGSGGDFGEPGDGGGEGGTGGDFGEPGGGTGGSGGDFGEPGGAGGSGGAGEGGGEGGTGGGDFTEGGVGSPCSAQAECNAGLYCGGGLCTPQLPDGEACSFDAQCESGACLSGVCTFILQ